MYWIITIALSNSLGMLNGLNVLPQKVERSAWGDLKLGMAS